jgi:hypothetical protein
MTNEVAVSLKMPRRPVAKQVCCGGAIGTGGAGGGTAACGDSTNSHFCKVWPFWMCRSHFTSRAIAGDSTNVNALARSNLRITFFLVDRGELVGTWSCRTSVSIGPTGRLHAEVAGSEQWALDFFAAIQHHIRKLSNDRFGVCSVLHRLPLKSASETFDGDIAARIAGAAFTCDDEDLSSISRALMARRRERSTRLAMTIARIRIHAITRAIPVKRLINQATVKALFL